MLPVLRNNSALAPFARGPINRPDSIFDHVFGDDRRLGRARSGVPVAMWPDDDHIDVEAELPGMTDRDLDITVHNGLLFIRGEREPAEDHNDLHGDRFERAITLPEAVDADGVQAELKDGVLCLTLPKSPRPIRRCSRSRRADRVLAKVAAALVTMALVLLAAIGSAS
jgi:HSP20 family protein